MQLQIRRIVYYLLLPVVIAACTLTEPAPTAEPPAPTAVPAATSTEEPPQEATAEPTLVSTADVTSTAPAPTEMTPSTPEATPTGDQIEEPTVEPLAPELIPLLVRPENHPPGLGDIAVVSAEGTGLRQLTTYLYNADPVLSPDGRRIAYRSVPITITSLPDPGPRLFEGAYNIWVITTDGDRAWQLTSSEAVRSVPSWSSDGERVFFSQGQDSELVEFDVDRGVSRVIGQGFFDPKVRPASSAVGFITLQGGLAWIDDEGMFHDIVASALLPTNTMVNDFEWLPGGQSLVYTLADHTEQVFESTLGIKYSLWSNTLDGSSPVLLADGARNAKVSPDGRTVAVLTGSGYGDACIVDQRLAFLKLGSDPADVQLVDMGELEGFPSAFAQGSFYPWANVTWVSRQTALAQFGLTCEEDRSAAGLYLIDIQNQQMVQVSSASLSAEPAPVTADRQTGIEAVDRAIDVILSNDLDARRELIHYTTAGCTTVSGLGGPPKCEADQAENTPVSYFPVLGPGEGQPVAPEDIDDVIAFSTSELYAAYRAAEPAFVDEFYPSGTYGLIFLIERNSVSGLPSAVTVRLDEDGQIIRLDFPVGPLEVELRDRAAEILVPPPID